MDVKPEAAVPCRVLLPAAIAAGMLVACAKAPLRIDGTERISDRGAREAVIAYYRAEARHDWKAAYGYRSDAFHRLVGYAAYAREMQAGEAGWRLQRLEILSVACGHARCRIRIRFTEGVNKAGAERKGLGAARVQVDPEDTTWRVRDGDWSVLGAGTRNHLALNADIADN